MLVTQIYSSQEEVGNHLWVFSNISEMTTEQETWHLYKAPFLLSIIRGKNK